MVAETGRITKNKIDIDEELKEILNYKLQIIRDKIILGDTLPNVKITYFVPDLKKDGGKYVIIIVNVLKIDEYNDIIILKLEDNLEEVENKIGNNEIKIPISEIFEIEMQ